MDELAGFCAIVIVVSTTGDGEPPDNARPFFRLLRKYLNDSKTLKHVCYTVLGLGDTNYSKFCRPAKDIDSMFQSAGAIRFFNTGLADDGVGLDTVVEPWRQGLWPAIANLREAAAPVSVSPSVSDPVAVAPVASPASSPPVLVAAASSVAPMCAPEAAETSSCAPTLERAVKGEKPKKDKDATATDKVKPAPFRPSTAAVQWLNHTVGDVSLWWRWPRLEECHGLLGYTAETPFLVPFVFVDLHFVILRPRVFS